MDGKPTTPPDSELPNKLAYLNGLGVEPPKPEPVLVKSGTFDSAKHKKVEGAWISKHEFDVFVVLGWKLDGLSAAQMMKKIACQGLPGELDDYIASVSIRYDKEQERRFWLEVDVHKVKLVEK